MTTPFGELAYYLELYAPQEYGDLRKRYPKAEILNAAMTLGDGASHGLSPQSLAAAHDLYSVGLKAIRRDTDKLMKRVRGRMRAARRLRIGGAVLAMASSVGFAGSTLALFTVDQKIAGLTLSGLGFLGGLSTLSSDEISRGGPPGSDGRTLFDRLVSLQGHIAAATSQMEGQAATGDFSRFDALENLSKASRELRELQSRAASA
jgi:hypothetical protein